MCREMGIVAFTIPDEAQLSTLQEWEVSDLNHSSLLLGDFGVSLEYLSD